MKESMIRKILSNYKANSAKMKKREKKAGRKKILQDHHIEWIQAYMVSQKGCYVTAASIKKELLKEFEDINTVSTSTITKTLHQDLGMKYKKLSDILPKENKNDKVREFFESAMLLLILENEKYNTIYLDEFSVSSRRISSYGWEFSTEKNYVTRHESSFSMSFTVAFTKERLLGIMGTEGTNDSHSFKLFLHSLLSCVEEFFENDTRN